MPTGIYDHFKIRGHVAWNKSLMKETSEGMRKNSKSNKGKHAGELNGFKGKHHTEVMRIKLSESHRNQFCGELNANWRGGSSLELYTREFNRQLKELIRDRDNYQCQRCGMPECESIRNLDVHHIDYNRKNCLPSNLISLCRRCNLKVNGNREYWEQYFKEKLKKRISGTTAINAKSVWR